MLFFRALIIRESNKELLQPVQSLNQMEYSPLLKVYTGIYYFGMFITRLCNALKEHNVPYAIVGGHAVALHGAIRGTIDIDFVTRWNQANVSAAETALITLGLQSRLPLTANDIYHFRDEYIQNRNLTAWSFYNPTKLDEQVDLLIHFDLGKKKVLSTHVDNTDIHYLNKKDLIKMKQQSGRPQDLADIEALEKLP